MRSFLTYAFLIVFFIGLGVKVSNGEALSENDRGYIVEVGQIAPDFMLHLTNGDSVSLGSLRGKVVMLQFTASWCSVCRKEMPFIESEIWQKYKDRNDFFLAGIDRDEPLDKVKNFAETVGITYPLALDPGADIFAKFALKEAGVTRNVIIDRTGKIVYLTRLFNRDEFDSMKKKIAEILDQE
ncbi:TlpA family protein disulfide reductase [Saccharicrinis sp. FJH54]|uniref:TlpA family protein disulfide reductase n=1 Tax=Saccharicrinis sp. FJH54 TaxID=3344665 RepID=UPI0035D4AED2